jgi:hypothetical protein
MSSPAVTADDNRTLGFAGSVALAIGGLSAGPSALAGDLGFAVAGAAAAVAALLRWPGDPGRALGVALCAVVLCGPVVHPWYVLWGLVPLAAGVPSAGLWRCAIALSVPLCLYLMPYGLAPTLADVAVGVVGLGAGLCYLRLRPAGQVLQGQPVAVDAESADHPGRDPGHHRVVPELLARVNV